MCVAAVFEVLIRSLANEKDADGTPIATKILPGKTLDGTSALSIAPYVLQFESSVVFPDYKRKFSGGAGDAFVLFGMGRYVTFDTAKPGDFIYFNRVSGGGHAAIFINYLDAAGKAVTDEAQAAGFRYFSAQKIATNGMGYRDAFFGACPAVKTKFVADCRVLKSPKRGEFSVSRLYEPRHWFTAFSAIRIERYLKKGESIDAIFADESNFRNRAKTDLEAADEKAREYGKKKLFPLIVPKVAIEADAAAANVSMIEFSEEKFGPSFEE